MLALCVSSQKYSFALSFFNVGTAFLKFSVITKVRVIDFYGFIAGLVSAEIWEELQGMGADQ